MNIDRMFYVVITKGQDGLLVEERQLSDMDRATTVKDISEGQFGPDVVKVIEFNPVEHTSRDVTESIASDVCDIWAWRGEELEGWQRDFVETHFSVSKANAMDRRAA